MSGKITLKSPVMIDGEKVSELAYDVEKIDVDQFMTAETLATSKALALGKASTKFAEFDSGFHLYLGIMAILAANPGYVVEDIERIKGPDIMKVMMIGRNFMTSGAAEEDEEDSDEPEETGDQEREEIASCLSELE